MRQLGSLLNNRWVYGIIGILAISTLIWRGADYVKFGADNTPLSTNARLLIIAAIVLIWVIWSLVRWGLQQRKNNQMMDALQEDDKSGDAADPDQERSAEEIKLINDRFRDALGILKKSRFNSESGGKTVYQLPWYIIIGPPGAGKTTALVNSGLHFPLAETHGSGALGGIGGTRHCDWWFTNDAVLIDTAGRYTTQDSHRVVDNSSWVGFLKLLKKYRPRRPVNGVIIAISLQELMVQTANQRQQHAKTIRSRIDELQEKLGIDFPVYLMFTKGDLVAGFSEFFANLSQAERAQVWGMTFPLDEDQANLGESFRREYSELVQRLNERLLWRIDTERSVDARALIQGFPNRMDALQGNLEDFICTTFAVNKFNASPMLRGVYFSSATQEGSPIDRMMASVNASFGLPRSVAAPQAGTGKSFFLNRLITDVIFAESELTGTNRKVELILRWGRRLSYVALAAVSVVMVVVWAGIVTQNRGFMDEVAVATDDYEEASKKMRMGSRDIVPTLNILKPLRQASLVYDQEEHPWLTGLGLYDGRVDAAAKSLYQENIVRYFLPSFRSGLERELSGLTAEDAGLPNTLGVYIMLSDKSRQNNEEITSWAQEYWQDQYKGNLERQQVLMAHLEALLREPLPESEPDPRLLLRVRQQLSRIPKSQRLYKQLQHNNSSAIDLYPQIGGDSELSFGIRPDDKLFSTAMLYTKKGFDTVDYSADSDLINRLEDDSWIYGSSDDLQYGEAERAELSKQIKRTYLTDYVRNWQVFLKEINIARFRDLDSAVDTLNLLSDPSYSPLLTTLELVTENTELRPPLLNEDGAFTGVVPDELKPTLVDREFRDLHRLMKAEKNRPAQVQEALRAIEDLKEFMAEIASDNNPGAAAYKVAKARFNSDASNPIQKLRKRAERAPEPLQRWLEQIADHSWVLLLAQTSRYISDEWNQQVFSVYQRTLADRYPLNANSSNETPLTDFTSFIGPKGVESAFFAAYLQPFVDSRKWKLQVVDNRSLSISNEALQQLRRAHNLRQAYYLNGSDNIVFKFRLKPTKLDAGIKRFSLDLARERISYSHGPQISSDVSWTSGEDDRIRMLFEDLNGGMHRNQFEGDWAWMHLLDASSLRKGSNSSTYNATFKVGSRKVQYQLTSKTAANPFNTELLRGYRCPQRL